MDSEARHPDTQHPDAAGRLRVVDVRIGSERRQLHFGGGFACVIAETEARSAAARWIAATIAGSDDAAQTERGLVRRLQSPPPLRAPAVLDRDSLQTFWTSDCARRLELIEATRESLRSEREQVVADLNRVRLPGPLAPRGPAPETAEAELAAFKAAARRFMRVQTMLGAIDALAPAPLPEALQLADEWDAHTGSSTPSTSGVGPPAQAVDARPERPSRFVAPRIAAPPPVTSALPTPQPVAPQPVAPQPVAPPPVAAQAPAPDGSDEGRRVELERLHRAVVKAEAKMFGRRALRKKHALARYNEARAAEQAALNEAGVETYAAFLIAANEDRANEDPANDNKPPAEEPRALNDVRRESIPREAEPEPEPEYDLSAYELPDYEGLVRAQELRTRAAVLLGRDPGDDVSGALRAHVVVPQARAGHVASLAEVLREEGLGDFGDADDVVARARAFVETPPSIHVPQPPTWPMLVSRSETPHGEIDALEHQLEEQDDQFEELEADAARIAATRDVNLLRFGPEDITHVVSAMFDAYRAGEVLEGHLPLVLDGVLDGLASDARDAAVLALASVDDIQVIVVTDDNAVTKRISEAGGTIVHWPAPEAQWREGRSG